MDNSYIVRFIRKDGKPVEEFFYHTFEAAISHFLLFKDDDSDLYTGFSGKSDSMRHTCKGYSSFFVCRTFHHSSRKIQMR